MNLCSWHSLSTNAGVALPHLVLFVFSDVTLSAAKLNSVAVSPQANYTDRATAAVGEVVPTFASRGCYVVSATDSHGR
jgi:hypothetical protein